MLPNAVQWIYPLDVQEVVRLLKEKGRQVLLIAGGTTAALSHDPEVTTVVDLTRLGLDSIDYQDRQWRIGCNVRLQQVATHQGLQGVWNGMLNCAAQAVGSRPIRNMVTLGGNVIQLFRWSDPPVALMAMDALFELTGSGGSRTLTADQMFSRHPRQILAADELLTRVIIEEGPGETAGAFIKYSRTAFDLAVIDVAACLWLDEERCHRARVAIGGTRNLTWRALEAESILSGKKPTAQRLIDAAKAARAAAVTSDDVRTSKEYRLQMLEVMVRRTLEKAVARAKESR